jgi:hypothetical protein
MGDRSHWELGDMALEIAPIGRHGVNSGAQELLTRWADEIGAEPERILQARKVSARWPGGTRVPSVAWAVHRTLCGHDRRHEVIRDGMTVVEAKRLVDKYRRGTSSAERDVMPDAMKPVGARGQKSQGGVAYVVTAASPDSDREPYEILGVRRTLVEAEALRAITSPTAEVVGPFQMGVSA